MRSLALGLTLAAATIITAPAAAEAYTHLQLEALLGAACPSAANLTVDQQGTIRWKTSLAQSSQTRNCLIQASMRLQSDVFPVGLKQTNKVEVLSNGKISIGYK